MATCACTLITVGIPCGCDNNLGGISAIYITDYCNLVTVTATAGEVTALDIGQAGSPATTMYEYCFNKNTSSLVEQAMISIENGSLYYTQTATIVIPRREVAKRNALAMLMQKNLLIIVKDQNGLYWLLGETNGVNITDINSTSGVVKSDLNGYTLTFVGEEPFQAQEVDPAIIAGLL
jgi:hypothetical protein